MGWSRPRTVEISPLRSLLHISDVHFGSPHLPEVAEGVLRVVQEGKPDVVVLSGDLTQRAKAEQFRQARAFVDRISVPTVVVPGNHDVPLYRVWERALAPYAAYRKHFAQDLEPIHQDLGLFIIGINTAHGWTLKDGRIRLRRLLEVEAQLRAVPESVFKVVVAHHHLIPPPTFGTQRVLINAFEAIDVFSRAGVDLVLSGHLHQAFIGNSEEFYPVGRPPVVIVHSGTTTSNRGRGVERLKNSCNWIDFNDDGIRVSNLRWHPELERFAEHSRHVYPRQERNPYCLEGVAL